MQTVKTAVVVVLLLAVLYGAYTVINQPPPKLPPEVAEMSPDDWDDEPTIAIGNADAQPVASEESITAFDTASNSQSPAPMNRSTPGLLPDDSLTSNQAAPAPSRTSPTSDPTENQQTSALLAAPQPLSETASSSSTNAISQQTVTESTTSANPTLAPSMMIPEDDRATTPLPNLDESNPSPPTNAYVDTTSAPPIADAPAENSQPSSSMVINKSFAADWKVANQHIADERYVDALRVLSAYFGSEDLTPQESEQLIGLLDPLAGKVIYSREHLIERAHKISRGETLYTIAEAYQVPWQLLQNVNGVQNPEVLVPGTELKVIRGPFNAQIDVKRSELTVFTDGMYAGRFPISVGSDFQGQTGEFQVRGKSRDRAYIGVQGQTLQPGHPENPYGDVWLDLGGDLAIHGSPKSTQRGAVVAGAISLSPIDAKDVYGILSKGSRVTIIR